MQFQTAARSNTNATPLQRHSIFSLFGPPTTLEECPNWRYLFAGQMALNADQPPTHEDPWIEAMAGLAYADRHGTQNDREPTALQLHILKAFVLHTKGGRLVTKVLECRLAGDESLTETARKCNVHADTIAAYAAILCDLKDHRRWQAWHRMQLNPLQAAGPVGAIMAVLQNTLMFQASEGLEETVDVLCRLHGPTMADGLPPRDAPTFLQELRIRVGLAQPLLPRSKRKIARKHKAEKLHGDDAQAPLSAAPIDDALQILQRAKVTKQLQAEIQRLREFCRHVEQRSACAG